MKRIMSAKKIILASLTDHNWRTVKLETEKINDLLTNIPTSDITELNDLIYARTKLVCEKSELPWRPQIQSPDPDGNSG